MLGKKTLILTYITLNVYNNPNLFVHELILSPICTITTLQLLFVNAE